MINKVLIVVILIIVTAYANDTLGNELIIQAQQNQNDDPEQVVRELYDLVTIKAGDSADWHTVRSLFYEDALVVLRTSKENSTVFSVDGFINDFKNFIVRANIIETGFTEEISKIVPVVFGDIAHFLVLYEASIPGSGRQPQMGVDSFHLIKSKGKWLITSIINEVPGPDRPLPEVLSD